MFCTLGKSENEQEGESRHQIYLSSFHHTSNEEKNKRNRQLFGRSPRL